MSIVQAIIALLVALAPPLALVCLFMAGLAYHREQAFVRYLVFALIFLNVRSLIVLFSTLAGATTVLSLVEPSRPFAGASFLADIAERFDREFVRLRLATRVAPIVAGFFIVRAIVNVHEGHSPARPVIAALFLLSIVGTHALLLGMSAGSQSRSVTQMDTFFIALGSLFNYTANRICPAAAGFSILAAIVGFAQGRSWAHYLFTALGFLTVSGLLVLLRRFVTMPI